MADGPHHLSHLQLHDRTTNEEFRRSGGGNPKIRPIEDRAAHGEGRLNELQTALASGDEARNQLLTDEELRALGTIITLEGADPAYPLKLDSLQQLTTHHKTAKRPRWLLLSVLPADSEAGLPERATVWVSDEHRQKFLKLFEDYLAQDTKNGNPQNRELVANIARIRATILRDLWQSGGEPVQGTKTWWEVWLRPNDEGPALLRRFGDLMQIGVSPRVLRLVDRDVMWVDATWAQLELLSFSAVPIAEIRRPKFVDTIEDLSPEDQAEYVNDLAERLQPADHTAPAVCHLDTGVARTHVLLDESIAPDDLHTVLGASGFDQHGHGTKMAGVALLGDLDSHLLTNQAVVLRHRLESVRILPYPGRVSARPAHLRRRNRTGGVVARDYGQSPPHFLHAGVDHD